MPVTAAPAISGNPSQTSVMLDVITAWKSWQSTSPSLPGWHLVNASELGASGLQLINGVFSNANAEAIVAAATYNSQRTLALGFRGTNDNEDWRHDFQNINEHYGLFAPLIKALSATIARGEFDLVLVGGHSLGGAMTQMFMADYSGIAPAYAITTGSPGYLQAQAVSDARIINYQVTDDPIVYLADNRAIIGLTLSSPLGAAMVGQISATLAASFGIPPSLFSDSIPFMNQNYFDRGTNVMLQVPGHPAAPPSNLLTFISTYNNSAHEFPAYVTGVGMTNSNPFDLRVGGRGTAGNDALFGTTGDDTINGDTGVDTLYLHVNSTTATITIDSVGALVGVASADSGKDSLASVERLVFTDKRLAFDLGIDQSAGKVVRVIGAIFDGAAIQAHPDWVGIGLQLFDNGMSLPEFCGEVVHLMGLSNESFVNTVYQNLVGGLPPQDELLQIVGLLKGSGGTMTQAEMLALAANHDANAVNIGLVGLQTAGVEFV